MTKKARKSLAAAVMLAGVATMFIPAEGYVLMNVGILATLIGLIWFIIA